MPIRIPLALALAIAAAPSIANAGPYSEIASAFDKGDTFDLHTSIEYVFTSRSAAIKREYVGFPFADPDGPVPIVKDLVFSGSQHLLVPKLEVGIFTDLAISFALPIVIRDSRSLSLDQRGSCVFPGGSGPPTCIDRTNSSTIQDGILPPSGFDSSDPGGPGFSDADSLFKGVNRSGLDQLEMALIWAPMNQVRDDTKPTWKIGAELHLAVGEPAQFDRDNPDSKSGIGEGVHEVLLWTSIARRLAWTEPYFEVWWKAPIGTSDDSPLAEPARKFGAEITDPQISAGTRFGFEAVVWEKPETSTRVSVDLGIDMAAHFEGRGYTEMWEVLAYAGDLTAGGPLVLDGDPVAMGVQALSHPGVTNIENYLTLGGSLGVRAELGDLVRIGAHFHYRIDTDHAITFADAGVDLPTCSGSRIDNCETDSNDVVNPGTEEVNPLHNRLVDLAGHRYLVSEARDIGLGLDVRVLF